MDRVLTVLSAIGLNQKIQQNLALQALQPDKLYLGVVSLLVAGRTKTTSVIRQSFYPSKTIPKI